jgi:predicted porin
MQKKLITLAVAGALGAPVLAYAQASTVEIYGRANLAWEQWKAGGATAAAGNLANRTRIADSGSRIGFRVNENLGGGLRAFVVIESGVNIDNSGGALTTSPGQSGGINTSTGVLGSRDSYLGLGGSWGDLRMGRQSIYWVSGPLTQTGPNYIDMTGDLTTSPGMVAIPVARNNNVLAYNSPTWSGFNFTVSYSPNLTEGGLTTVPAPAGTVAPASTGYTGTGQNKDDIWGITLRYSHPQFYLQGDWARRKNANANFCGAVPATVNATTGAAVAAIAAGTGTSCGAGVPKNTGWKGGIGWIYQPGAMLAFLYQRLRNDNVGAVAGLTTAGDDLRQNTYLINWEHMFGNQWSVYALYWWSSSVKGLTGAAGGTNPGSTKTQAYTIAAKYHFSKRTGAYISWTQIRNQANQWGDAFGGGMSSGPAPTGLGAGNAGADPRNFGVGMMHNF